MVYNYNIVLNLKKHGLIHKVTPLNKGLEQY